MDENLFLPTVDYSDNFYKNKNNEEYIIVPFENIIVPHEKILSPIENIFIPEIVNSEPNLIKRDSLKKNLIKAGLVGAGVVALSGAANAASIFWRDESGVLTDLKNPSSSGNFVSKTGDTMTGDLVVTDVVQTRSGTVTRDGDGYIATVTKVGGKTRTVTRDANKYIATVSDGTHTYTFNRTSGYISSWSVL